MKELVVVRLDQSMYRELEQKLTPPVVTSQTTDLQAGYQLGVQSVLKMLREGYTLG
jgi:hypothetical protein